MPKCKSTPSVFSVFFLSFLLFVGLFVCNKITKLGFSSRMRIGSDYKISISYNRQRNLNIIPNFKNEQRTLRDNGSIESKL